MAHVPPKIAKEVRARDLHVCRGCGIDEIVNKFRIGGEMSRLYRQVSFDVHHIRESDNHSITNLITVCKYCHRKLHQLKNHDDKQYNSAIKAIRSGRLPFEKRFCDKCYSRL